MITDINKNENPEIECQFGNVIRELKICKMLKDSNIRKQKGFSAYEIFQFLLILVFQNNNLYHFLNSKKKDTAVSKNTYYRFLNESSYNWKKFLALLAGRVCAYFTSLTSSSRAKCLVLDDSVIPRERSKKVELLSYVYDHVSRKTKKGFNMLTLGWTDGYSFVPIRFHMLASPNQESRIMEALPFDKRTNGYKRRQEAVMHKPEAAIGMIRDALHSGIQADYVLMDTWFTNEPLIKNITEEGLDVIGMLKDVHQYYDYHGRLYTLKQLSSLVSFHKPGDIFGSVTVKTRKYQIPVRIIFVRNRNKKSEYITILTTDISLSDGEAVRLYGNRWKIEVFFRASKSLLSLGSEYQGLSYDLTVSSTTIVFTRYILLEWMRRKNNDQKTICELFYVCCDDIQDIELSVALKSLLKLLTDGIRKRSIIITKEIKCQLIEWFVSQPAFIQALYPDVMWEV